MSVRRSVVKAAVQGLMTLGGAAAVVATGDPGLGVVLTGLSGAGASVGGDVVDQVFGSTRREALDAQVRSAVSARFPDLGRKELKAGLRSACDIMAAHALTMEDWAALDLDPRRAAQTVVGRAHEASGGLVQAVVEETYRAMAPYQVFIVEALTRLGRIETKTDRLVTTAERQTELLVSIEEKVGAGPAVRVPPVGNPPDAAPAPQPRSAVRDAIDAAWSGAPTVVMMTQVLRGDGGVGKSQLAGQYFRLSDAAVKVWVDASRLDGVISGYAAAARAVGLRRENDEALARAFRAWLAAADRTWFVVLDDLDVDPVQLAPWWPPTVSPGRTLVTTRRRGAGYHGSGRVEVDLDVYTPAEAASYVTERLAGAVATDPAEVEALTEDLGRHPVALSLAAAVIIDSPRFATVAQYRQVLHDRSRSLTDALPGQDALHAELARRGRPTDDRWTIAAIWDIAVERATERSAHAPAMAALLSFAHPTQTPRPLFLTEAARRYLGSPDAPLTDEQTWTALDALVSVSLVAVGRDPWSPVAVHALAQRTIRDTLDPDQQASAARALADAAAEVWDSAPPDGAGGLRATVTALRDLAGPALVDAEVHRALFLAGDSLGSAGRVRRAVRYYEDLRARLVADPDRRDVLAVRRCSAFWRAKSGDVTGAIAALEDLLVDLLRVLGPDHPDTLLARHNIARWRATSGDVVGGLAALEDVLADSVRVLGLNHYRTLSTRHYIARWRAVSGDIAGGLAGLEEVLAERLKALGRDHYRTLSTRHDIAHWRAASGDITGGLAGMKEVLAARARTRGRDHPDTLSTRHDIARWRAALGDVAGGLAGLGEVLADRVRVLGPDHPSTLSTRHYIARWRAVSGDVVGGLAEFEKVLVDKARVLGPDHPSTLSTRHNVARWRAASGDVAGGLAGLKDVLADRVRVLGPDHPDTLSTRYRIAYWCVESGDTGGLAEMEDVLANRVRVLGPDHPGTMATRRSLEVYRRRLGGAAQARIPRLTVAADSSIQWTPFDDYVELMGMVGVQTDIDDDTETPGAVA